MPRFKRYKYDDWANAADRRFGYDAPWDLAIDTETYGFAWDDPAFCATVTWRDMGGTLRSFYLDLDYDDHGHRLSVLRTMLDCAGRWIFHNAKFDLQKLDMADALPRDWRNTKIIEDTNIIHALLDENSRHGLKYLAAKLLGESTNEEKVLAKTRRKMKIKKDDGYNLLPREVVAPYALKDTEFTLRLWENLAPQLPEDQVPVYGQELDTMLALLDIEGHGIGVDVPYLERTASEYGVKLMQLDAELQRLAAVPDGGTFNPNSPKQILEALERRGIQAEATDKDTLSTLNDSLAETLLEHRRVKKLHSTYLVPLLKEQRDGVIHPNFNLTLPRTGRMSSSGATNK